MVSISRTSGVSETLSYDPFGMLLSRQIGTTTTYYLGRDATVTNGSGGLSVDVHMTVGGQRMASVRIGAGPRTLYLHRDRVTSVVATTLAGGVAGASYRYAAHGAVEVAVGDAGTTASELGYAGALRLSGGLLWMGARVYNPALKVFMQPDPLAPFDYTYAAGDPINKWDPTGMVVTSLTDYVNRVIHLDGGGGGGGDPTGDQEGSEKNPTPLPEVVIHVPRPTNYFNWAQAGYITGNLGHLSGYFGTPWFYVSIYRATSDGYRRAARSGKGRHEYLIDFGFRYALMFAELAERTDSTRVKEAVQKITLELQIALISEIERDVTLLDNPTRMGEAAFLSHADAYRNGGFGELDLSEQVQFFDVINGSDMIAFGIGPALAIALQSLPMINPGWPSLVNP